MANKALNYNKLQQERVHPLNHTVVFQEYGTWNTTIWFMALAVICYN